MIWKEVILFWNENRRFKRGMEYSSWIREFGERSGYGCSVVRIVVQSREI